MPITEIATWAPPPTYIRSNAGRAMVWHGDRLYVSADNANIRTEAGDVRPAGCVFVIEIADPFSVRLERVINNPDPTGLPNRTNEMFFNDRDGFGWALAEYDLGVVAGCPFHDGLSGNSRHNCGMIRELVGPVLPAIPMPPGAQLGYSLAGCGNIVIAGAPGAQQAVVYEVVNGRWRVQPIRPPWWVSRFGERVGVTQNAGTVCVNTPGNAFWYDRQEGGFWSFSHTSISPWYVATPDDHPAGVHVAWLDEERLIVARGRFDLNREHIPFRTEMPPQFIPIVWVRPNVFAVGDVLGGVGGAGCVRFYEVT